MSIRVVARILFSFVLNSVVGTPAIDALEKDLEHELEDLLDGTQLSFDPQAVPPSCKSDVQRLCVNSQDATERVMWLNCLMNHRAELSDICLEDYVRTLPFVCKADEARFCEAQSGQRLRCLFGVTSDLSGRCLLSVKIAKIVLEQREAKGMAEDQAAAAMLGPSVWHDAAEQAIQQKKAEEVAEGKGAPQTRGAANVASSANPVVPSATQESSKADEDGVVEWLTLMRWCMGLVAAVYVLYSLLNSSIVRRMNPFLLIPAPASTSERSALSSKRYQSYSNAGSFTI